MSGFDFDQTIQKMRDALGERPELDSDNLDEVLAWDAAEEMVNYIADSPPSYERITYAEISYAYLQGRRDEQSAFAVYKDFHKLANRVRAAGNLTT